MFINKKNNFTYGNNKYDNDLEINWGYEKSIENVSGREILL